ncbi:hypothetical protein BJ170DRAFT_433241 [Xylariales sp. AK1849]|nr:hypothetical protein BJ170DRAFT_433241 [Xylariales sp. AK1849]
MSRKSEPPRLSVASASTVRGVSSSSTKSTTAAASVPPVSSAEPRAQDEHTSTDATIHPPSLDIPPSTAFPTGPPVYFWRENHPTTGFLSQWYHSLPFFDPSDSPRKIYNTAEHYMMHHKAVLFNDCDSALAILEAGHPRNVKALGRKVTGYDDAVW